MKQSTVQNSTSNSQGPSYMMAIQGVDFIPASNVCPPFCCLFCD